MDCKYLISRKNITWKWYYYFLFTHLFENLRKQPFVSLSLSLSSSPISRHSIQQLYGMRKSAGVSLILRLASAWLEGDITSRGRFVWTWNLIATITTCGYYDFTTLSLSLSLSPRGHAAAVFYNFVSADLFAKMCLSSDLIQSNPQLSWEHTLSVALIK